MPIRLQANNGNIDLKVPVRGGGIEQVQADWAQNDSTAKDYIKNKPCYTITGHETERILEKSEWASIAPALGLVLGETYTMWYQTNSGDYAPGGGKTYTCQDMHDTDASVPAGTLYFGTTSDYAIFYDNYIELNSGFGYMVDPQRFKIVGNLNPTTVVPLQEKYYPETVAKVYVKDKDGVNIDNAVLNVQDDTLSKPTKLGDYYAVKRDTTSNTPKLAGNFVPFDRDIYYNAKNTNFKDIDKNLEMGMSLVTPENYPSLAYNLRAAKSAYSNINSLVNTVTLDYKDIKFKTLAFFEKSSGTDSCISGLFLYNTTLYQFIFTAGSTGDKVSVALVKLANYTVATKDYVNTQIAAIDMPSLDGYATQQWVENKGYLTEHQSLADYALKSELPTVPTSVSALTNDSGYLTLSTLPKYTGGVE